MVIRALLACTALAGCTIKDIDYTGKACPCPSNYECNTPTQTCVKTPGPDDARGGVGDGSPTDDGNTATDSCFSSAPGKLVLSSVGFPEFPNGWLMGLGQWTKGQGEILQQNGSNEIAWLARSDSMTGSQSNYRVVVAARLIDTLGDGGAGAVFRAQSSGSFYACTLDSFTGQLRLRRVTSSFQDTVLMTRTISPPLADIRATFKIEAMSTGSSLQCCVRGYSGMTVSAQDTQIPSGSYGIASFHSEAAFSEIYVYE